MLHISKIMPLRFYLFYLQVITNGMAVEIRPDGTRRQIKSASEKAVLFKLITFVALSLYSSTQSSCTSTSASTSKASIAYYFAFFESRSLM
jgi:hypothetical protein